MTTFTPFADLDQTLALRRIASMTLAPDVSRAVAVVAELNKDATSWVNHLWEVSLDGSPARKLTRGEKGESGAAFTPSGDVLFVAKRGTDDEPASLWLLPSDGGEPREIATHPGGIESVTVRGYTAIVTARVLPSSTSLEDDAKRRKARKDAKVEAILHTSYPVRYWDHDLGPSERRFYAADLSTVLTTVDDDGADVVPDETGSACAMLELCDMTPDAGTALEHARFSLAEDGSFLVTEWAVPRAKGGTRLTLVRIELESGARTVLVDEDAVHAEAPCLSPDGLLLAYQHHPFTTPEQAPTPTLRVRDCESGEDWELMEDWDNWPGQVAWLNSGNALVMATDADGRGPLFVVPLDGGDPVRLTDEGTYSHIGVHPSDELVVALRTSYEYPLQPVAVELELDAEPIAGSHSVDEAELLPGDDVVVIEGSAEVRELGSPAPAPALPGHVDEVSVTVADGSRVRGWLALPDGASAEEPVPLLLWIHGGPLNSWNAWSWRWNPWSMVAAGYAVLLPDPALSTGYGQDFIQRGWGAWGGAPFTDLMEITDAVEKRPDIDETRVGAMGGSFGGYMANWVAGHTDRFKAIVTHASLWALDQFGPTTDNSVYWEQELTAEAMAKNSPHTSVAEIRTPMLVIHGDKDYRVPIGEGLRLWYELNSKSGLPAGEDGTSPHQLLYFPNENHWVLTPQHAKIWYQVVLRFLAEHVLGEEPGPAPELLG